jgi:hypothetical protein
LILLISQWPPFTQVIDAARRGVYNIFEKIKKLLKKAGLRTSCSHGAVHIRQLHGRQTALLNDVLDHRQVADAFPAPYRGAVFILLSLLPFYTQSLVHALYPSRTYGAPCSTLSREVADTSAVLRTIMSSIFVSVPKKDGNPSSGWYGPFTPPSNWGAVSRSAVELDGR